MKKYAKKKESMKYCTRRTFVENFKIGDWVLVQYEDAILPVLEIQFWRDYRKILLSQP